jgi:hypothetical protein
MLKFPDEWSRGAEDVCSAELVAVRGGSSGACSSSKADRTRDARGAAACGGRASIELPQLIQNVLRGEMSVVGRGKSS